MSDFHAACLRLRYLETRRDRRLAMSLLLAGVLLCGRFGWWLVA